MTWPVFAVIQIALTLVGAIVVFALHHRRISGENARLRAACEAAAASGDDAEAGAEQWLKDRLAAISGDDAQSRIQQLVLSNELAAQDDFADRLAGLLGTPGAAATWAEVRKAAYDDVCAIADADIATQARNAFAQYQAIDELFDFQPPEWPTADTPEATEASEPAGDPTDDTGTTGVSEDEIDDLMGNSADNETEKDTENEAMADEDGSAAADVDVEALIRENEVLKAENADLKKQADDEGLRNLLKQFTQDSREMMSCIQELEKENRELKEQLEAAAEAA